MERINYILEDGYKNEWKLWQFAVVFLDQIFHPFQTTYPIAYTMDNSDPDTKPYDCMFVFKRYFEKNGRQTIWYFRKW